MRRILVRVGGAAAAIAVTAVLSTAPALAHEQRQVGAYQLTVGWQHEPTYVGEENAVQIFVHDAGGQPVDDLGNPVTLKVQVIYGGRTSDPLDLQPSFDADTGLGTHGEWDAAITPTAPGNYTFHLTGSINGQPIDEKFTSSDSTFDPVANPSTIEFPAQPPTNGELAANLDRTQPRVADAQSTASSAKDSSTTAVTIAVIALVLAIGLGVPAIVVAIRVRRQRD